MKNIAYLLALHAVEGVGSIRLKRLIDYFHDPQKAWEADTKELLTVGIPRGVIDKLQITKQKIDPEKYYEKISCLGIQVMTLSDERYPSSLKEIYDPPFIIYYRGEFTAEDLFALGVVGTRKVTHYGKLVTEQLVRELVSQKITIVSGLARGVDTIAHQTAAANQGRTIAVLGGGLDKIFPPENEQLTRDIAEGKGVVLSEFPPQYPPLAGNFPARNRIIAGLSRGVLVTEAAEDSGSLITARLALEQGKDVFAVPGPITSSLSKGTAQLIQEGAKLVTGSEDILQELGMNKMHIAKPLMQNELTPLEAEIVISLENEQKHVDEICRTTKRSIHEISGTMIKLEIMGVVKNIGSGIYIKN